MEIKWHVLVDFDKKNALCKCMSLFEFLTRNGVVGLICIVRWVYHHWNPEIRLCCNISSFRFCFDAMGKTDDQLLLNNMNHVHWRKNTIKKFKAMFPSYFIWFDFLLTFLECSCPVKHCQLNRWQNDYRYVVTIFDGVVGNLLLFERHPSVDRLLYTVELLIHDFDWKDYGPWNKVHKYANTNLQLQKWKKSLQIQFQASSLVWRQISKPIEGIYVHCY